MLVPSIQDMINAASPGSVVIVPPGNYSISQTIVCAPGVSLSLYGVTLTAAADVDIIRCAHRSHISGGFIDASLPAFTHACLKLDGDSHFDMTFQTIIRDVQILGNEWNGGAGCTGVHAIATQGEINSFIYGVVFDAVSVSYCGTGLWMQAIPTEGDHTACINGNRFSNLLFAQCRNGIKMEAVNWAVSVDGNTFSNVQIQPDSNAIRALYCEGAANIFNGLLVWDWSGQTAIELTGNYNQVGTNLYTDKIVDNGLYNKVRSPFE